MIGSTDVHLTAGPFRAGGSHFIVETNSADLADEVTETMGDLLSDWAVEPVATFRVARSESRWLSHPWSVSRDGEVCESSLTDDYVVPYLLWEVTRLLLERSPDHILLHGGAAAFDGRAVVLAGQSRSGKSTLAGWLTHRGWGYLTDEVAIVDPDAGTVLPFWRPIGIRAGPLGALCDMSFATHEILLPASRLGSLSGSAALHVFVFPAYDASAPGELSEVSPSAALAALSVHHPGLFEAGRVGFRRLAGLIERVPAYALAVDDLDAAERTLRRLVLTSPSA